jgi:polysaccharide export outer membrane protein
MRVIVVVTVALSLAACGGARPGPPASLPAAVPPVAAKEPGGSNPAARRDGAPPPDSGTAALNSEILTRATGPAVDADLPVGPGDLIEVSVFEVEELSKLKVRISRRGTVNLPLIGTIQAAGRSAGELEDEIRQRLQHTYMRDPQVSVFVHEHTSQRISIIGAVKKGGIQVLTGRLRLADALALAEGLTEDADHVVYVIRRVPGGTVARATGAEPVRAGTTTQPAETEEVMVPIDLEALARGRDELNIALEPGDVINVPRAGSFYVGGSVEKPGSFLLRGRTTVEQGILAAGGAKNVAALENVRIYRTKPGGQQDVIAFDLKEFESGQTPPELQKNDVVIVGKSPGKAFWFGFLDFFKGVFGLSKGL